MSGFLMFMLACAILIGSVPLVAELLPCNDEGDDW